MYGIHIDVSQGVRTSALVAAAALMLTLGPVGPGAAETFKEALTKTYTTNPTLKAAQAQLRAVNEQVPQALSNWRPSLEIGARGDAGKRRGVDDQFGGGRGTARDFENYGEYDVTAELNQNLFRGGRTVADTRRAKAEVESQRSVLTDTEQDVLFDAISAYADVWRDQEIVVLNDQNVQALRDQRQATLDRFEVRAVTDTDVQQSESRLARAVADRATAEQNLISSRAFYEQVVGNMPTELERPPLGDGVPSSLEAVIEIAVANNPQVVAANFAERADLQDVRVQFGELLPEITAGAAISQRRRTLGQNELREDASVFGQVRMPLYERGLVSSRIREAKERANQSRIQIEEARRQARQEAIDAWEALQSALRRIEAYNIEVESTRVALDGVREEATVGARTILDILDAVQEVLDARTNLVGAERDQIVATYLVLRAMGLLTASNLALDGPVYDPRQDYDSVKDRWYGFGELPYISEW